MMGFISRSDVICGPQRSELGNVGRRQFGPTSSGGIYSTRSNAPHIASGSELKHQSACCHDDRAAGETLHFCEFR